MSGQLHVPVYLHGELKRRDVTRALRNPHEELGGVFRSIPGWDEVDVANVAVERISGAMTNVVFRCRAFDAYRFPTVILRLFGPGNSLFSHADEREVFLLAGSTGIGPRCLVEFEGGRVEEFVPGASLSARTMRDPTVSCLIAHALASFHLLLTEDRAQHFAGTERATTPAIYRRIRRWYGAVQDTAPERLQAWNLQNAMEELAEIEAYHAAHYPLWLGFCHNDLQYGNMLLCAGSPPAARTGDGAASTPPPSPQAGAHDVTPASVSSALWEAALEEEAGGSSSSEEDAGPRRSLAAPQHIRLIDYEYATLNDIAFDIANHWCECAADYHADEAHRLDFGRMPGSEEREAFARAYVDYLDVARRSGGGCSRLLDAMFGAGREKESPRIAPAELARLLVAKAEASVALSDLKWGLWGLLQAQAPGVDFEYLEYARQRIEHYHLAKTVCLDADGGTGAVR